MLFAQIKSNLVRLLSLILAVATLVGQVRAQDTKQPLTGVVVDPARAPIAGAKINAALVGRGLGSSTLSDQAGQFSLALEPGTYTLTIVADGFEQTSRSLDLTTAARTSLLVVMEIAPLQNTISVVATDYQTVSLNSATKTSTLLRDIPQSISVVTREQIRDQLFSSVRDVVR